LAAAVFYQRRAPKKKKKKKGSFHGRYLGRGKPSLLQRVDNSIIISRSAKLRHVWYPPKFIEKL
jgi:hypothetical protein